MADLNLKVDYDGIENQTIPALTRCQSRVQNVYEMMLSTVNQLPVYMEAESAKQYVENFVRKIGPSVQDMSDLIRQYHRQLGQISAEFRETDQQIARMITM